MALDLEGLLVGQVYAWLLIFARVGSAIMVMPGTGEPYVLARMRLWLGLVFSGLLAVPLAGTLPDMPQEPGLLARQIGSEVVMGLFIGSIARLTLMALHLGGSVIAMQSGLAAATFFDPASSSQGSLPGNLLSNLMLVVLFTIDGHHMLLTGIARSYDMVASTAPLPLGDMAESYGRLSALAIETGVQIGAPLLVVGFLLYLLMGVLNRLMPSFQVLFVVMPLQIVLALGVLMLSLGGSIYLALGLFETTLTWLDGG